MTEESAQKLTAESETPAPAKPQQVSVADETFGLTKLFISKIKVAIILLVICVIVGTISYNSLPKEWSPDIQIPLIFVSTPYPQSSPEDVENLVTRELEKQMKGIKGLDEIRSTSAEGVSLVTLEFKVGFDISEARNEVQKAIDSAKPDLPDDALEPVVSELNLSEQPIMVIVLSGDANQTLKTKIADDMIDEIESVAGVLEARRIGGEEKEVQVLVDPQKLEFYKIGLDTISRAIQNDNRNTPIGKIDIQSMGFLIRTQGEIDEPTQLGDIIIASPDGTPVYLRDLARVTFQAKDVTSISRLNNKDAVNITVSKRAGENLQKISAEVKDIIAKFQKDYGSQIAVSVQGDQSVIVNQNLTNMENNIYTGFILVALVLLFFMGVRNAILVGVAVPLSMLLSFIVLRMMGITLNMVVVFSLILALGMLVDNAIVVVENIYRHVEMGKNRLQATLDGTTEVARPVISSTLTTLAAFFPLIFMPGIVGQFIKYMPITIIVVLVSSLVVALIFNPVLCRLLIKIPKKARVIDEVSLAYESPFLKFYGRNIDLCLRYSWLVILGTLVLFVAVFMYYISLKAGVEFFPKDQPSEANISIKAPLGSTLDESNRIVSKVEKILEQFAPYTKSIVSNVGSSRSSGNSSGASNSYITLTFPAWESWIKKPNDVIKEIREALDKPENQISGAEIKIEVSTSGPPGGKVLNIELSGDDLLLLKKTSEEMKALIKNVEGLVNLEDNLDLGRSEIRIIPDRQKLADAGISINVMNDAIRTAISGKEVSTYRLGKDDYKIVVKLEDSYRKDFDYLLRIPLRASNGNLLPLSELASWQSGFALGNILHIDRERTITVRGDASGRPGPVVLKDAREKLKDFQLPEGVTMKYTGENERQQETQKFLVNAFLTAFLLIFLILAWEFHSFIMTFSILLTILLAFIGVFLQLSINRAPFSIVMGGIGLVSLAGIVVNNGIVMLDYIKYLKRSGNKLRESIILAGMLRLRPIFLTATTTVLAMVPLIIGMDINFYRWPNVIVLDAGSGAIWRPMAMTLASGLTVATIITLFFLPSLYYALCWVWYWMRLFRRWIVSVLSKKYIERPLSPAEE